MADTAVSPNNKLVTFQGRKGTAMAKLDADDRKKLPGKDFAGPDRSYPVEDRSHAANAKARATQMFKRGVISEGQHAKIIAKADKVLGK